MGGGDGSRRVAITLEGRAPMRGVVDAGGDTTPIPFTGWLGLLRVLEGSLAPPDDGEQRTDDGGR